MAREKKVFIFDDNEELLELCTLILEDIGCEIKTSMVSDNPDEQVLEFNPDIIFMDNWLPNISGVEATKIIKANKQVSHIPVIYISANNNVEDLAREAGADDYLAKPFDISDLEEMVRKYAL
ncbi:MAG: response regulator [Ginsengibacter sp.]|jgi:two-component system cell cycle response regulator DivK